MKKTKYFYNAKHFFFKYRFCEFCQKTDISQVSTSSEIQIRILCHSLYWRLFFRKISKIKILIPRLLNDFFFRNMYHKLSYLPRISLKFLLNTSKNFINNGQILFHNSVKLCLHIQYLLYKNKKV